MAEPSWVFNTVKNPEFTPEKIGGVFTKPYVPLKPINEDKAKEHDKGL